MMVSFAREWKQILFPEKRYFIPIYTLNGGYRLKKVKNSKFYSILCGSKMPARCNRGFCCRSYCLLNIFRAPLCPLSGAQEYYKVHGYTVHQTMLKTFSLPTDAHNVKKHRVIKTF